MMLLKLIESNRAAAVIVTFDHAGRSFRDELHPEYKHGRPPLPTDFSKQLDWSTSLAGYFGCQILAPPAGFEADDVLATVARTAAEKRLRCDIISSDRDLLQTVADPWVRLLLSRRGVSQFEPYDESRVLQDTGVKVSQLPDLKALMGDKSDNYLGVRGIGPKTAADLIHRFGSVVAMLEDTGGMEHSMATRLRANASLLKRNLQLAKLSSNIADFEILESRRPTEHEAIEQLLTQLGLLNLLKRAMAVIG